MSNVLSKLIETYMLEEFNSHIFSDMQFGFIKGRGTNMAASLVEDVTNYCVNRGSSVFMCSLDIEGTFDGLPHAVLFRKAMDIFPDLSWRLLYYWYSKQCVFIKWNNEVSQKIRIGVGTRQGGLTSPYLFNLFYQDMIELNNSSGGIRINGVTYNAFGYADDALLASLTSSGLQNLIDCAVQYVTKFQLSFNPLKTTCLIKGKNPFTRNPVWSINKTELTVKDDLSYLGIKINDKSWNVHTDSRITSCRRAFFSLQGAGLCKDGVSPKTAAELWRKVCNPVLTYGCETVNLTAKAGKIWTKFKQNC